MKTKANIVVPISGLTCSDSLKLDSSTELNPMTANVRTVIRVRANMLQLDPSTLPAYECNMIIRGVLLDNVDLPNNARAIAEEMLLRLRLYQPGGVGFQFGLLDFHGWSNGTELREHDIVAGFHVRFYTVWYRPEFISEYELNKSDETHLQMLFHTSAGKDLMKLPAYRYFFRSYHEPYATDRFLSNAIALESLLVNDQKGGSISYKFRDRGTLLLQLARPHLNDNYWSDLRDIYNERSSLVHSGGGDDKVRDGVLNKSEEYLRILLRFMLKHPKFLRSSEIDKAKRQLYRHATFENTNAGK